MSDDIEHEPWRSTEYGNLALVRAVKERPCLYNNTIPEYSNKDKTAAAWQEIADEFGCSVEDCKRKWKNLRTVYARELVLVEAQKKRKPYYLVNHMDFINPFLIKRPRRSYSLENAVVSGKYDYNTAFVSEESIDSPYDNHIQKEFANAVAALQDRDYFERSEAEEKVSSNRTIQPVIIQCVKAKKEDTATPNESMKLLDNPRRQFVLSLLPELDEMTEKQFRSFKRKIFQTIDEVLDEP